METISKKDQKLDSPDKDLKSAIINMFKDLKEPISKQ